MHSSHVNAGNPLYRNPVRAHWTQDTSAMAMHGDKREDESIRVHRQLPVETIRSSRSSSIMVAQGIVIVTSMLLSVIAPHYISDVLWESCYAISYCIIDYRDSE